MEIPTVFSIKICFLHFKNYLQSEQLGRTKKRSGKTERTFSLTGLALEKDTDVDRKSSDFCVDLKPIYILTRFKTNKFG